MSAVLFRTAAEKVLIYDEERGIISVDKNKVGKYKSPKKAIAPPVDAGKHPLRRGDIHTNRRKDPPDLYFKSGLQYFMNNDYVNALKNFTFANAAEPKPEYALWMGKTYRQLDQHEKMLKIMDEILRKYPESSVADDALFETAFYYQRIDDYYNASLKYAELAEQYPFGTSYSNGEEFLEVSRTQRQLMRAEMVSALKVLGYKGDTPEDAYRDFQKRNSLPVTGTPTQQTVKAVKAQYEAALSKDEEISATQERVKTGTRWALAGGGVLIINLILVLVLRGRVAQRKRQISGLENMLSDIDLRKL